MIFNSPNLIFSFMKMTNTKSFIQTLIALLLVAVAFVKPTVQIKGVVVAADTKQPVANAYLYIIKGEEEILTDAKGEFSLTSAEQLPCTITIIHKDFRQSKYVVKNPDRKIRVELQRK